MPKDNNNVGTRLHTHPIFHEDNSHAHIQRIHATPHTTHTHIHDACTCTYNTRGRTFQKHNRVSGPLRKQSSQARRAKRNFRVGVVCGHWEMCGQHGRCGLGCVWCCVPWRCGWQHDFLRHRFCFFFLLIITNKNFSLRLSMRWSLFWCLRRLLVCESDGHGLTFNTSCGAGCSFVGVRKSRSASKVISSSGAFLLGGDIFFACGSACLPRFTDDAILLVRQNLKFKNCAPSSGRLKIHTLNTFLTQI